MSKIAEFKALEAQLAEQLRQLEAMRNDGALQREIEFEEKLRALMAEYGMSLRDIIALLAPSSVKVLTVDNGRRERKVKVYKNPTTGEIVETKGGNHKVLKLWKAEFGVAVVESWLQ